MLPYQYASQGVPPSLIEAWELKPSTTTLLELETAAREPASLLKEELLPTGPLPEGTALEGLALLILAIRIIASVEAGSQLRIAEHLVRLVDLGHFLLGLLLGHALRGGLVGMELPCQGSVCALDGAIVGVVGDAEDFVVVLCLGAFQADVSLLREELDVRGRGMVFLGCVEGLDGGFEGFIVLLALGEGEEAREGGGVDGQGFGAVGEGFLFVIHLGSCVSDIKIVERESLTSV